MALIETGWRELWSSVRLAGSWGRHAKRRRYACFAALGRSADRFLARAWRAGNVGDGQLGAGAQIFMIVWTGRAGG